MCKGKAQNRIDYIVLQNPKDAAGILEKHGYEAPRKKQDIADAMKQLVKRKGEPVIKELVAIHPERDMILKVTGHHANPSESNFCGCNSAYTGDLSSNIGRLGSLSLEDLNELYEDAKKKSREKPNDKLFNQQVEVIWDELKKRKSQTAAEVQKNEEISKEYLIHLALAFLAGIAVAKLS